MDCTEFMWDDVGPLKDEAIKLWTNDTSVSTLKYRLNTVFPLLNMESIKCRKFQIVKFSNAYPRISTTIFYLI